MTPERLAELRRLHGGGYVIGELLAYVDELRAELEPEPKVDDTVQLVIPRGPMLDGLQKVLRALGCVMAGPLPLEREPIPTYVLQPLDTEEPTP